MSKIIPRKNNFDILRLLFALTVALVHLHILSANPELRYITKILSSKVAVDGFFIISGFLIFMSYENSTSLKEYLLKRFRRIYPAYFLVVISCALLGFFISVLPANQYFSGNFIKYLAVNLLFLNMIQPTLPGVFLSNPVMAAVNGSLWTIKIEVMFYCSVPLLTYFMRRYNKIFIIVGIYLASYAYSSYLINLANITGKDIYLELSRQLPGQLMYFMSGAFLFYFFDTFHKYRNKLVLLGLIVHIATSYYSALNFIAPACVAIGVIYIALCFPDINFMRKYGDLSYGTYLYHFPIIQTLISTNMLQNYPYHGMIIFLVLTLTLAFLSWILCEKPFLKQRLVNINKTIDNT